MSHIFVKFASLKSNLSKILFPKNKNFSTSTTRHDFPPKSTHASALKFLILMNFPQKTFRRQPQTHSSGKSFSKLMPHFINAVNILSDAIY